MSSSISSTISQEPHTGTHYSDQFPNAKVHVDYPLCCYREVLRVANGWCGPRRMALHAEAQEVNCNDGDCWPSCQEGCTIRVKNLANCLFCPVEGCGLLWNLCTLPARPLVPPCCNLTKLICPCLSCDGIYLDASEEYYCKSICPVFKLTCLETAWWGLFILKSPCNLVAPELLSQYCHQETTDLCIELKKEDLYFQLHDLEKTST